jgi:hypothetical protein
MRSGGEERERCTKKAWGREGHKMCVWVWEERGKMQKKEVVGEGKRCDKDTLARTSRNPSLEPVPFSEPCCCSSTSLQPRRFVFLAMGDQPSQSGVYRAAKFGSALLVVVGCLGIATEVTRTASGDGSGDAEAHGSHMSMSCPGGFYCPSGVSVSRLPPPPTLPVPPPIFKPSPPPPLTVTPVFLARANLCLLRPSFTILNLPHRAVC